MICGKSATEEQPFDPLELLDRGGPRGGPPAAVVRVLVADAAPAEFRDLVTFIIGCDELEFVGEVGTVQECLQRAAADRPDVVLAAMELPDGSGLDVARSIDAQMPRTAVLLQLGESEPAETWRRMLQAGVRGCFSTPAEPAQLLEQIRDAAAVKRSVARTADPAPLAAMPATHRLITFTTPCRGVGQTTLAVNTAICLGEIAPTVLVDFRMPLGDAAIFLNLTPRHTVAHLAQTFGAIDAMVVKAVLEPTSYGIKLLAAPVSPPGEETELPAAEMHQLMQVLGGEFRFIVVDAPAPTHPLCAPLLEKSDALIVTARADISRLRTVRAFISTLEWTPAVRQRVQPLVIVGPEKRECRPRSLPELCGHPSPWTLPFDDRAATRAINLGQPVCAKGQRSALGSAIRKQCHNWSLVKDQE